MADLSIGTTCLNLCDGSASTEMFLRINIFANETKSYILSPKKLVMHLNSNANYFELYTDEKLMYAYTQGDTFNSDPVANASAQYSNVYNSIFTDN